MRVPSSSNSGTHAPASTATSETSSGERFSYVMSVRPASPEHGENGETADRALLGVVGAVRELLRVIAIGDVLNVEVRLELGRADLEFLGDANVEREERIDARAVRLAEHGLVHAPSHVVVRTDDRRARIAGGRAGSRAHVETGAEIV